ncbi:probable histidine kinase 5 isoform X1 [Typha latifolia]|uniref:probable histidine kinase 5 isoform X1 n=2 Tax=Typha latifolia TaxID=4733 RepID=UPI003C2B1426
MKSLGIASLLCRLRQAFLKLLRWVLLRMARNGVLSSSSDGSRVAQCDGCRRWKSRLLLLCFLGGVLASIWLFAGFRECQSWVRKEKVRDLWEERAQVLLEQFNLSKDQLQALGWLLSSSERVPSACIETSVSVRGREICGGLSSVLKAICSEGNQSGGEQDWVRNNAVLQGHCPVQDKCIQLKPIDASPQNKYMPDIIQQDIRSSSTKKDLMHVKECENMSQAGKSVNSVKKYQEQVWEIPLGILWWILVGMFVFFKGFSIGRLWKSSNQQTQTKHLPPPNLKSGGKWRKKILLLGVLLGILVSIWIFLSMKADIIARRKETIANMCDERARMLQDQFNVSMNHVHALAILVSTFHHMKNPSAIDQKTFAEYTARTAFERPLTSGVAYALKVLHSQREQFEQQHGWKIKKMETEDHSPVQDDYNSEMLDPSPVQDEYAPVIFSQETVSHIVSVDMMSGKEDRDNILRARSTGKGVLTSPFNLLKSNHLGVVLTFAVYNSDFPIATPEERIEATIGYLGASFDVPSLVEKLLQQLASKQTIVVNVYDTTNSSAPIRMYGPDATNSSYLHISNVDFGDPMRKHEMHCRFKHEPSLPWSAITTSLGVAVIVLLVSHIFYAALNRIEKVEDDYHKMRELKVRAEAADVAKSQFLATVSHEIRTPMNGVLGMLQMLMDTELDATQQDFAMTAQASGKALITLINEVLDQAKIESGRLELEAVPFDVHDVLDNVLSLFSDKAQVKGIELAVYVSDQVPDVLVGDPGRLRQIITNLVGNSVKFTEGGHIYISVHLVEEVKRSFNINNQISNETSEVPKNSADTSYNTLSGFQVIDRWKSLENFRMFKSSTEDSNAVNLLVTVEDTGVGIPEDAQRRIFTPFMQADSSTSRKYGGTGIGLSISKCLVDLMRGEIGFVSRSGIGSTFSFTATFTGGRKNTGDIKRCHSDPQVPDFQGMRALIIDGRSIRAEVTKYHLQRLGVQADIAINPETALTAILEACSPSGTRKLDMVLVDKEAWGEGSGLAFPCLLVDVQQSGTIKPHQSNPKMFLLATSLSPAEVDDSKSVGYTDSIRKPLRLSMMAACFRKALGIGSTRQQLKGQPVALRTLLRGRQILVVDDNAVNRKVAAGALKKFGAIVTCADCGKDAIAMLQPPHKFDACFMDVQMPEMDGFEATRQIRCIESKINERIKTGEATAEIYGHVAHWHIPVLAMTADVIQATHEECLRCGMDDYVSKPFEEEKLYSAVAHFFDSDMADSGL